MENLLVFRWNAVQARKFGGLFGAERQETKMTSHGEEHVYHLARLRSRPVNCLKTTRARIRMRAAGADPRGRG
jgi:hypothetical protein